MTLTKHSVFLLILALIISFSLIIPPTASASLNYDQEGYQVEQYQSPKDPLALDFLPEFKSNTDSIILSYIRISYTFPTHAIFMTDVDSQNPIASAAIYYSVEKYDSRPEVYSKMNVAVNTFGTSMELQHFFQMSSLGSFPPDTVMRYWWEISDIAGNTVYSDQCTFIIKDIHRGWQSKTEGYITVYWYNSSDKLVNEFLKAAENGFKRISKNLGIDMTTDVRLYIYPSPGALREALNSSVSWIGGIALYEYNAMMIGCADNDIAWGKNTLVHELTHLATRQVTGNAYVRIPTWLNEGISVYAEGSLSADRRALIESAKWEKTLFSVNALSSPFPSAESRARLAYAQSYSFIEFLIKNGGSSKLQKMLALIQQGTNIDDALMSIYGFDMEGMTMKWFRSIGASQGGLFIRPIYIVASAVFLSALVSFIVLLQEKRKKEQLPAVLAAAEQTDDVDAWLKENGDE